MLAICTFFNNGFTSIAKPFNCSLILRIVFYVVINTFINLLVDKMIILISDKLKY
jgi:hypothetical protein